MIEGHGQEAHAAYPSLAFAGLGLGLGNSTSEWFKHFVICCRTNEWSDAAKALKLPLYWRVRMELSEAEKEDDKSAKTQMITRMALARFVSLKDFKGKRLLLGEPLLVFLHVLK